MAQPPLVSIMIPTYGQADLVARAIDSALAQDYANLEIVVSDDASPDATAAAVQKYNDPRLRYHRSDTNRGRVGNYRHALYDLARGEWVVNLDGDDCFMDPGFISAAMQAVRDGGPDVVLVTGRVATWVGDRRVETPVPPAGILDGREFTLRASDRAYHLMHLGCVYRRQLALALSFYRSDAVSSDWESLYRLACHGNVAVLGREVGRWHVGRSSASEALSAETTLKNLGIWTAIEAELVSRGVDVERARQAMSAARRRIALGEAVRLARRGQVQEVLQVLAKLPAASGWERLWIALQPRLLSNVAVGLLWPLRRRHP